MEFSTVPQEVLDYKRQMWVTPGSRQHSSNNQPRPQDFSKNVSKFYGVTPASSNQARSPIPEQVSPKNAANFYGSTPPVSASKPTFSQNLNKFYGVTPPASHGISRPISNNTDYQINQQRFYLNTPASDLQLKKNTKNFYQEYSKSRSPLVSAGKNSLSN